MSVTRYRGPLPFPTLPQAPAGDIAAEGVRRALSMSRGPDVGEEPFPDADEALPQQSDEPLPYAPDMRGSLRVDTGAALRDLQDAESERRVLDRKPSWDSFDVGEKVSPALEWIHPISLPDSPASADPKSEELQLGDQSGAALASAPARPAVPANVAPYNRESIERGRQAERKAADESARAQTATGARGIGQKAAQDRSNKDRRHRAARDTGINVDPKQAAANADAQVEGWQNQKPFDARADLTQRENNAALAQDTASYDKASAAWERTKQQLMRDYNAAVENDDRAGAAALADQMTAHDKTKPVPTERMTGGRTPQELREPIQTTLGRLSPEDREALKYHFYSPHAERGPNGELLVTERAQRLGNEAMTVTYDELEPEDRLQAMKNHALNVRQGTVVVNGQRKPGVPKAEVEVGGGRGTIGFNEHNNAGAALPAHVRRSLPSAREREDGTVKPGGLEWTAEGYGVKPGMGDIVLVNGHQGMQAPSPQIIPYVQAVKEGTLSPEWDGTEQWIDQMVAVGHIVGLDPAQYPSRVKFAEHAAMRLNEAVRMSDRADIKPVLTEGDRPHYRYRPNAAAKEQHERRLLHTEVMTFLDHHPVGPGGQTGLRDRLLDAADAGDRRTAATIMQQMRQNARVAQAEAHSDLRTRQNTTRMMQRPDVAPAMLMESLAAAGDDPARIAAVYRQFGMPDEANSVLHLENERLQAGGEADLRRAQIGALDRRGEKEERTPQQVNTDQIRYAIDQFAEPGVPEESQFANYEMAKRAEATARGQKTQPTTDEVRRDYARDLLAKYGERAWESNHVKRALLLIANSVTSYPIAPGVHLRSDEDMRRVFVAEVAKYLGPQWTEHASRWWATRPK